MTKVFFTPNSLRRFQSIKDDKLKARVKIAIQKLAENPIAGKKLKGELSGQYTLRVWPWRIIYYVKPNKDAVITDIGHRKEVYR